MISKIKTSILIIALSAPLLSPASNDSVPTLDKRWLHVYAKEGIQDFHAYPNRTIEGFTFSPAGEPTDSLYDRMSIKFKNEDSPVSIPLADIDYFEYTSDLPVIDIRLNDYPDAKELWNKELYLDATVNIDGGGVYEDIESWSTTIKGRGNTTWGMPKKPYRFKASKKISLFGMKKAKSYALIANYIDCSHMRNFVAFELARQLGMPFTNSCVPVRVHFNDNDKGLYFITEKIGIGGASVDIDEETGWLLELDVAMDEDYVYRSEPFDLPVMLKDPDLADVYSDPEAQWDVIKADFNNTLAYLQNCTDESWREVIDAESLMNYLMVFTLARNGELRHPKSVYVYKGGPEDKYHFGPVWDFDWAFTFTGGGEYTGSFNDYMLASWDPSPGNKFFYALTQLPGFMDEYRQKWDNMATEIFPVLLVNMDAYAARIKPAAISDGVIWNDKALTDFTAQNSFDFNYHHQQLRQWLQNRVEAANNHPHRLLIQF